MPRRDANSDAAQFPDGDDFDSAELSDDERKAVALKRLEHLVALRDAPSQFGSPEQQRLLYRAIQSVYQDCTRLGLTREAQDLMERRQPPAQQG
jgi:hypothetical protein